MNIIKNTINFKQKFISQIDNKYNKDVTISKTLSSVIFLKNNQLYCYNSYYSSIVIIPKIIEIYSNDDFYMILTSDYKIIILDDMFRKRELTIPFSPDKLHIKKNYVIIQNLKKYVIVNMIGSIYLSNYDIYDLDDIVLFNSNNKNYITTKKGLINNVRLLNPNVEKLVNLLKCVGDLNKLWLLLNKDI